MIKVSLVDDQVIILNGLQKILSAYPHIEILNAYTNGEILLEELENGQPDVLLLDLQMPNISGLELASILSKKYPDIKIIALSNVDVFIQMKQMIQNGCKGYLLKDVSPEILVKAIETVYEGGRFLNEDFQNQLLSNISNNPISQPLVTRREKEILKLITEEHTNQDIASMLFLSLRTVENHRNNLLQKLKVKNTAGLVKIALQQGLVS